MYLQSNPCEFDLDGAMAALVSDFLSLLELKMEDLDLFGLADSSVAAAAAGAAAVSTVTPSASFVAAAAAGLAGSRTAPFSPSFSPSSGKGLNELPAENRKGTCSACITSKGRNKYFTLY